MGAHEHLVRTLERNLVASVQRASITFVGEIL